MCIRDRRANLAVFMYDYENLQFQATDPDVFQGGVANIPDSEMSGIEVEVTALITDNVSLDVKMSKLDSEVLTQPQYGVIDNSTANDGIPFGAECLTGANSDQTFLGFCYEDIRLGNAQDITGNELAKSPDLTMDITLSYEEELPSGSVLSSSLGWVYRGDFMQRVNNNTLIDPIDAYTIINFTASLQPEGSNVSYDLLIMNATNEDAVNSSMTDVFGANATGLELIPPRQIMARVTAKF